MRRALVTPSQMNRYPISGVLREAANFAKGVLIGSIIVLFVWVMIG